MIEKSFHMANIYFFWFPCQKVVLGRRAPRFNGMVSVPSLEQRLLEPLHQREVPTSGGDDNKIRDDKNGVVAPSI
jgi:hypothetical protein